MLEEETKKNIGVIILRILFINICYHF